MPRVPWRPSQARVARGHGRRHQHPRARRDVDRPHRPSSSATLELSERDLMIAERVLKEVNERLRFLLDVGLDYLNLNRSSGTLAGGEAQRIRLASQVGSGLVGVLYVLDEPSIGLHQRDNQRLDRHARAAARPRQHRHRRRARRGDDPRRRLRRRHRARARGSTAARSSPTGALDEVLAEPRSITGPVPDREALDPVPGDPAPAGRGVAHGPRRARAQPQGHRRRAPARVLRRASPV